MSRPCTVHQWSHLTEPCPYCREINAQSRHPRPHVGRQHGADATHSGVDQSRAERLCAAILAAISGDVSYVGQHFTQDVVGSGPTVSVKSREELAVEIEERDGTFTDVEVAFSPLEVTGTQAAVEWVASGVHSGPLPLPERLGGDLAPTGRRVRVRAITVAEFDGDQICSFRSYWDDLPALRDLRS
jgi:ketosteroid isomerase-like protein